MNTFKHYLETEEQVLELINNAVQENINLDYKACGSLGKTDGKKKEISKDVSAFANSAGGTIIYGVIEENHLPKEIDDGYNPTEISKEWLEQVINSTIQPRIDGILISPIEVVSKNLDHYIYIVHIPQSKTVHQASDKRYYKRFNFESVPMEDYEIRDVMNRPKHPILKPSFDFKLLPGYTGELHQYFLDVRLKNEGQILVKNYLLEFSIPEVMFVGSNNIKYTKKLQEYPQDRNNPYTRNTLARVYYLEFSLTNKVALTEAVIFPGQEIRITDKEKASLLYKVDTEISHSGLLFLYLFWKLYADNMPYKEGEIPLSELNGF